MRLALLSLCLLAFIGPGAIAQDDVADVPAKEFQIGSDAKKRYFLIGAGETEKPPKGGFKLLVVLPGGDGGAAFQGFVKRVWKNALDASWVIAQPVAVKWRQDQVVVWPTKENPVDDMEFTTEDFVTAVLGDVKKRLAIADASTFAMGWSSSGPPLYVMSLAKKSAFAGYYISMSVFKPKELPGLAAAKGRSYWIEHSPTDDRCPFAMAKEAVATLQTNGAKVKFTEFEGGHGWSGPVYQRMKSGFAWLLENAPKK